MRIAIIGSGPAGFYAAEALLKRTDTPVDVDVFDRLPTPYGLVRGGVAPDHQKIKSVTRVFASTAGRPSFRFLGNVQLGRDVTVEELRRHYHQIVYATGNEADRRLGIPGEGIVGSTPATVFVGWYNGHPDYRAAQIRLDVERVAVVGHGNVAVDAARILLRTPDELEATDIADYAREALGRSRYIEQPNKVSKSKGTINLWVTDARDLARGGEPRAFRLPYSPPLHEMVLNATAKMSKGVPQMGEFTSTHTSSIAGLHDPVAAQAQFPLTFFDIPDPLFPDK